MGNLMKGIERPNQVMDNELDAKVLEQIKTELIERKEQILKSLADLAKPDNHEADSLGVKFPEYGDKADENAQEVGDYSTALATEKVLEKTLEDINGALERIEKDTYGQCKYCNQEIGKKRLMARPTASSCVACKTELQENE